MASWPKRAPPGCNPTCGSRSTPGSERQRTRPPKAWLGATAPRRPPTLSMSLLYEGTWVVRPWALDAGRIGREINTLLRTVGQGPYQPEAQAREAQPSLALRAG